MMFLDALSRLVSRLGVSAFAGLVAFLMAIHVLSAVDWLWFLPDAFWPSTSEPAQSEPQQQSQQNCITMPDGLIVCDEPVPAISEAGK